MSVSTSLESLPLQQIITMVAGDSVKKRKGTFFSSVFALLTTCMGAGTLSLPYAFMKGGLLFSLVIFVLVMVTAIVIGYMLLESKHLVESMSGKSIINSYADLGEYSFGIIGKFVMLMVVTVFLVLCLIAYMIFARDQLEGILDFIVNKSCGHDSDCVAQWIALLGNYAVLLCISFLPLFPLLLLRQFTPLKYTNTLSIIAIVLLTLVIVIRSVSSLRNGEATDRGLIKNWPTDMVSGLTCVSYCSLTFLCHFNLFAIERELRHVSFRKMQAIIVVSMTFAFIVYLLVSIFGYLQFRNCTDSDVIKGYPSNDGLIVAARIALFFTLLFSYPVLMNPCRDAVNGIILLFLRNCTRSRWFAFKEEDQLVEPLTSNVLLMSKTMWFMETWILFAVTFVSASNITDVSKVWDFVGSIGGCLILYVLPPIAFLKIRYQHYRHLHGHSRRWWRTPKDMAAFCLTLIGLILLAVENYQAVIDVKVKS
ncbi:probable sodium-coupled neutral amino acid transporter 6 [Dysidea avara]|uniref:probable sodium-coupled neutral amino acid transporter 6 n=1 Tax=Dysidea avara TaxID=196820 RepID=UPI00332E2428